MKIDISKYASYIYVDNYTEEDKPFITRELSKNVYADYSNKDNRLIGIELLSGLVVNEN